MSAPAAILDIIARRDEYPAGYPPIVPHPVEELPDVEILDAWGEDVARKFLWQRHWHIQAMAEDPFRHGHRNPMWRRVDEALATGTNIALIMGGNRSSKSEYAARKVMETLCASPGKRAWCFQTTGPNSIEMQQPYIYKYIPKEWKDAKKGKVTDISYRRKTGFSESTFILPNESQCWFRNYAQDIDTIEGGEVDIIWFDELVPLDWVETALYRIVTRAGKMLVTFTPIEGYSPTVKDFLQGARTIETAPAELLPRDPKNPAMGFETVPVIQECAKPGRKIFYFHTADNPFAGWETLKATLQGASKADILCRAYGVPTKAIANQFPRFKETIHVVPAATIPKDGTWYHGNDPCSGRNFFMLWAKALPNGQVAIVREWPQADDYLEGIGWPGPWAEPDGKLADGKRGPAQKPFGFSLRRYADEIQRVNKELGKGNAIDIECSWMDSRFGNTPTLSRDTATTLIEQMEEVGIYYLPAPGENLSEGIDMINDALYFDDSKPIDATNRPRLIIADNCKNLIFALQEWTGLDGKHGASKDPIDVLRYLLLGGIEYIAPGQMKISGGGSY
jgi:phage terminase large subunit-like protein